MGCSSTNTNEIEIDKEIDKVSSTSTEMEKTKVILEEICRSICTIVSPNNNIVMGFLMLLYKGETPFLSLICNDYGMMNGLINSNLSIEVYYDNKNKKIKIALNKDERFIKGYENLNITIVEILPEDNINDYYFLLPSLDYANKSDNLKNKSIYIPIITKKGKIGYYFGEIDEINDNEFIYDQNENQESSKNVKSGDPGMPIFFETSTQVIGICKNQNEEQNNSNAILIFLLFKLIQENVTYDEKKYGTKIYKGEFFNGKRDGNGIFLNEFGEYYIGQWVKDHMHGKGKIYDKDGNLKYEGDFVRDKMQGKGKIFYSDDGCYYIGEMLNDKENGKGTVYYKYGSVKYKGDFLDGKYEGIGKYIFENLEYYVGHWVNGEKNGHGRMYYKNGSIKYEGNFVNDKYEGKGKLITEKGDYYIGNFLKGCKHGKGTEYDKDGKVKYKGIYVNNVLKNKIKNNNFDDEFIF